MSVANTVEQNQLHEVDNVLIRACEANDNNPAVRLEILEAAAGQIGGWDLTRYRRLFPADFCLSVPAAKSLAAEVLDLLVHQPMSAHLALSALSQTQLSNHHRRTTGAYYTDFRMASYVASGLPKPLGPGDSIVDPACGSGILLVAAVLHLCGNSDKRRANVLRNSVCASDASADALRGTRLSLASLTGDLGAVKELNTRLRQFDSLLAGTEVWADVAPHGFAAVIGNPPWEKLKVTRHESARAAGNNRHYGDDYAADAPKQSAAARNKLARYARQLGEIYPLSASGEGDLYKLFFELAMRLAGSEGHVALILPAGLIRSQNTLPLRERLLAGAKRVDIAVLDNHERFFAIDTRFKFLVVHAAMKGRRQASIVLRHGRGTDAGVVNAGSAHIDRVKLSQLRPDLSIPEVRSDDEWALFQKMARNGVALNDERSWWQPKIVREVDMTRDRPRFSRTRVANALPVIEGRAVHQFRAGAKSYMHGTGRKAMWLPNSVGFSEVVPQFWIKRRDLPNAIEPRTAQARIGFCDVTGQTNERTILAAMIPDGVVCGNKVPTLTFVGEAKNSAKASELWLAIANSFAFDWLARRVVTTTVNFFLLLGLPFPVLDSRDLAGRRVAGIAAELNALDTAGSADPWFVAEKRAAIDAGVALAYQLSLPELARIFEDFPLLDRGQPPIDGEDRSTVTRDLVLTRTAELLRKSPGAYGKRLQKAIAAGAVPYVPAQYVDLDDEDESARVQKRPVVK